MNDTNVLKGKNILIVDDDRINIMALSAVLKAKDPNIFVAHSGAECLAQLKKNPEMNLILLDLMMPNLDGYQTLERLTNCTETKNIPVIIVTARVIRGEKEKLIKSGASAYIEKPIAYDELMQSILHFINISKN